MDIRLGRLEEVTDLRTVWENEAYDFTPWLAEHIDQLNEALGLDLAIEEQESAVGDFRSDLLATEENTGRRAIIENQVERTDHDHLGKVLTYMAGKQAQVGVWVVKSAREEHRAAVEWLNAHTDRDVGFFLVETRLYRMGDALPAVKFDVVERPNDWAKMTRQSTAGGAASQQQYEFYEAFQDHAFECAEFAAAFKRVAPSPVSLGFSIGSPFGKLWVLRALGKRTVRVELLFGSSDKALFRELRDRKAELEAAAGLELDWRDMPQQSAISVWRRNVDPGDRSPELFDWIADTMLRMRAAFTTHINEER